MIYKPLTKGRLQWWSISMLSVSEKRCSGKQLFENSLEILLKRETFVWKHSFSIAGLKKHQKIERKKPVREPYFRKFEGLYLKKCSTAGVFLRTLWIFSGQLFYSITLDESCYALNSTFSVDRYTVLPSNYTKHRSLLCCFSASFFKFSELNWTAIFFS